MIASGPLAHLTTLNVDGSPQVSVVRVGLDGDDFVIGHLSGHRTVRNSRRDGRVVRSLLTPGSDEAGLHRSLVVQGLAGSPRVAPSHASGASPRSSSVRASTTRRAPSGIDPAL